MSDHLVRLRSYLLKRNVAGRVFITGTGRAGTSFLLQLLTDLGLDTGYPQEVTSMFQDGSDDLPVLDYYEMARAGFERDLFDPKNPFIVKSPFLCDQVDSVLEAGIVIGHLIIPVRNLFDAAESRRHVQFMTTGNTDGPSVAGGLWDTDKGPEQEAVLGAKLARLIEAAVRHEIPMTFLNFPRLVHDPNYTFEKLRFLLPLMRRRTFHRIFTARAKPELVHEFIGKASSQVEP